MPPKVVATTVTGSGEDAAAVKIQSLQRAKSERKEFQEKKEAAAKAKAPATVAAKWVVTKVAKVAAKLRKLHPAGPHPAEPPVPKGTTSRPAWAARARACK